MRAIVILAVKDLKILFRNPAGAFFTLVWPLLVAILFGSIFAGPSGGRGMTAVGVVVVDEDQSEESRAFLAVLQKAPELEIETGERQQAWDIVRQGRRAAYVAIVPGFGEARRRMFWGDPPIVELGVDPRRKAEAGMLQGILTRYAVEGFQQAFSDPSAMRSRIEGALGSLKEAAPAEAAPIERFLSDLGKAIESMPTQAGAGGSAWQPLKVESREVAVEQRGPANAFAVTFPQGILWGILGCSATFAIGIVRERTRGTLVRLQMAPLTRGQVLLSKGLACFTTIVVVQVVLLAVAGAAFGVHPGSLPLLALAALSVAVAFVGITMLFSVIAKTEEAVGGLSWAANVLMSMIGGGMMPLFVMPAFMQTASHVSPVKWGILALEGAIWRGFSAGEMLLPCGILVAVGVVCFGLGARAFRTT